MNGAETELEIGPLRVGIVGAGRLGCALGRTLAERGLELVSASSATPAGRARAARLLDVPVHEEPVHATEGVDVVLVCVPDDAVPSVAARLARRDAAASPLHLRIVSTSASAGLAPFAPMARAGHDVLVVHPVHSASHGDGDRPVDFNGAGAAVIADDVATATFGSALAHACGMRPFLVADAHRHAHAAACSAAATLSASMQVLAGDLAAHAGVHEAVARTAYVHLARQVLDEVERAGAVAAIHGPISRGDWHAVADQAAAVEGAVPDLAPGFQALMAGTAQRVAGAAGSVSR